MTLKILSLNIEKDRHLDRVLPFLKQKANQGFSVFCLQEVFKKDIQKLCASVNGSASYFPSCQYMGSGSTVEDQEQGFVILTTNSPLITQQFCYYKDEPDLPKHSDDHAMIHAGLIITQVILQDQLYTIASTHFPVAPGGGTNKRQDVSLKAMLRRLEVFDDMILLGDFNAPRGREVFTKLATLYTDNIPPEITTTIDGNYHRAGPLPYVVDGLFTSEHYSVKEIEIVEGLSDHKAIIAEISPKQSKERISSQHSSN